MRTYAQGYHIDRSMDDVDEFDESHVHHALHAMGEEKISRMLDDYSASIGRKQHDPTAQSIFGNSQPDFHIQAKLEISQAGDVHEQQADQVAESFVRGDENGTNSILSKPIPAVAPKGESGAKQTTNEFDQQLSNTKGQGQKLDESVKGELEQHTGTDLSGVNVHTSPQAHDMSESIDAKAFTHGQDIYFKEGNYNPQSEQGKELLAHEVTHTVQQTNGMVQPKIQRFEAWEHKKMGDEALGTSEATIEISPYLKLSMGDITALAGDYFESVGDLMELANKEGSPPDGDYFDKEGTVDEIIYLVECHIDDKDVNDDVKNKFSTSVRDAADGRATKLLSTNWSHFSNTEEGDENLTFLQKAQKSDIKGKFPNNEKAYRIYHEKALFDAFATGKQKKPEMSMDKGLLYEGFASHYLTDAFAAGHIRTQRKSIVDYWDKRYPGFSEKLKEWVVDMIALNAGPHYKLMHKVVQTGLKSTLETVNFSFGDLIAGVLHDYDNENGVLISSGGKTQIIYGDKAVVGKSDNIKDSGTYKLVSDAVKASASEIPEAFFYGQNNPTADLKDLQNYLRDKDGYYKAEKLWPKAAEEQPAKDNDNPDRTQLNWKVDTLDDLFNDPRMAIALKQYANNTVAQIFVGAKNDMSRLDKDAGWGAKKISELKQKIGMKGVDEIITQLKGDSQQVKQTLQDIINIKTAAAIDLGKNVNQATQNATTQKTGEKKVNIPYDEFVAQVDLNIINQGDNMNQMHSTDFCGKVAIIRMWIGADPVAYKNFMYDLYFYSSATFNGKTYQLSKETIEAINTTISAQKNEPLTDQQKSKVIHADPGQVWGETKDKIPELTNMMLYLTMAENFHFVARNAIYDPAKNLENRAWAGSNLNSEMRMAKTLGFDVEDLGDNLVLGDYGISKHHYKKIKDAVDSGKPVLASLNSYLANTHSNRFQPGREEPKKLKEKLELKIGTHWVALTRLEEDGPDAQADYWEYAGMTTIYDGAFRKYTAGAIIVNGYKPQK